MMDVARGEGAEEQARDPDILSDFSDTESITSESAQLQRPNQEGERSPGDQELIVSDDDDDDDEDDENPFGAPRNLVSNDYEALVQQASGLLVSGSHNRSRRGTDFVIDDADAATSNFDSDEEGVEDPFDDEPFDDDDDFEIVTEGDDDDEDGPKFDEDELAAIAEMKTFDEWKELDIRTKVYAFVEPSIGAEVEIPPQVTQIITAYAAIYFIMCVLHVLLIILHSFKDVSVDIINLILLGTSGFFAIDFLIRLLFCTRVARLPMIFVDLLTLVAGVVIAQDLFKDMPTVREASFYIAPFRSLRFFLITVLFLHTDTFRDINLAFITIQGSGKSLSIFLCMLIVGLFVFSTAVYLLERGRFDVYERAWFRSCKDFGGCVEEYSPFQSIPDALWLIINTMTTVGLGDVTPATTPGRVVTGLAMIAGVFVIAFPTMVLVGNLTLVRKNFFREEEIENRRREDAELALLEMRRRQQSAENGGALIPTMGSPQEFGTIPQLQTSNGLMDESATISEMGGHLPGGNLSQIPMYMSLHSLSQIGSPIAAVAPEFKSRAFFSFMGDSTREVRATKNPQIYHYQPIMQVLCDDDGKPIISCVHHVEEYRYHCQITLVVDDRVAQEAAVTAVRGNDKYGAPVFCRATPVYGMDVELAGRVAGVRLVRRSDMGEVQDLHVPLTLRLTHDPKEDIKKRIELLKKDLLNQQLTIRFSTQPLSCGSWNETVFITASLLQSTPFATDLKAIAAHVSNKLILTENQRAEQIKVQGEVQEVRKDFAYVTNTHLKSLLAPVMTKIVQDKEIVRNASECLEQLVVVVALHCRRVRFQELPAALHPAVYGGATLQPADRLYEIDVDYFRTVDWPIGSLRVQKAEKCKTTAVKSIIGNGSGCTQPDMADRDNFVEPFDPDVSIESSMLKREAETELQENHHRQVSALAAMAQRAEEYKLKGEGRGDFQNGISVAHGEETAEGGVAYNEDDDDYDDGGLGFDEDASLRLTEEEEAQVRQKMLYR